MALQEDEITQLAVEALAYDPVLADGISSASALVSGNVLKLQFAGGGRQLREQAIPLLFRITSGTAAVAVGQPLKVIAKTAGKVKGVDSKGTKANAEKGEISIKIKGGDKVTADDLVKALKDAGIEAKLTKKEEKKS